MNRAREWQAKTTVMFSSYPLFFWKPCCNCNKEFRRERGFRALVGPYHNGAGQWKYVCATCAPTKNVADEIFVKSPWQGKRPSASPAPGRPRKESGGK